jgi:uncharacterized protein
MKILLLSFSPFRTLLRGHRGVVAAAIVLFALLAAGPAGAAERFRPPPLVGHVVDMTGALGRDDVASLDAKLEGFRQKTGFAIVALVVGPLQDEPIDDVAYTAFNTWQIGDKGKDNGVLIVVAPSDRRVRIETGKGVGGALTDLQANDIIRGVMAPPLREGRLRDAIEAGAGAVAKALVEGTPGGGAAPAAPPVTVSPLTLGVVAGGVVLVLVLLVVSPAFRSMFLFFLQMLFLSGGRGGRRGGGGGGGSGYSGGGGRSGGGGSSDSY